MLNFADGGIGGSTRELATPEIKPSGLISWVVVVVAEEESPLPLKLSTNAQF